MAFALGFVFLFLGFEILLDRFSQFGVATYREDLRVAIVLCLAAAYLPAAWLYSVGSAQRTVRELRPWLPPGEADPELEQVGRYDRAALRLSGAGGVAMLLSALLIAEWGPGILGGIPLMSPEAWFHRGLLVLIGWNAGRAIHGTWIESRRFSRIGRGLTIDLLDPGAAGPLGRYGLRQALVTIGAFSVMAPLFYDVDAAPNLLWLLILSSLAMLVLALVALFLPVRGLHEAIVREKTGQLERANREIRNALDGWPQGRGSALAGWIAYRDLVESVREWPIDAPTARRFALYLAIPVGSWLGGALVERMLDLLLD